VNRGPHEPDRCPTWNICSDMTHRDAVVYAVDAFGNEISNYANIGGDSNLGCSVSTLGSCQDFLCGEPITAYTSDFSTVDWWSCIGSLCGTGYGTWQGACLGSPTCLITTPANSVRIVATPSDYRGVFQYYADSGVDLLTINPNNPL